MQWGNEGNLMKRGEKCGSAPASTHAGIRLYNLREQPHVWHLVNRVFYFLKYEPGFNRFLSSFFFSRCCSNSLSELAQFSVAHLYKERLLCLCSSIPTTLTHQLMIKGIPSPFIAEYRSSNCVLNDHEWKYILRHCSLRERVWNIAPTMCKVNINKDESGTQ